MARRATRRAELLDGETRQLLNVLGECRAMILLGQRVLKPGCKTYRLGDALLRTIDDLAEKLTGSREHFWTKPHSTGDRMRGRGVG